MAWRKELSLHATVVTRDSIVLGMCWLHGGCGMSKSILRKRPWSLWVCIRHPAHVIVPMGSGCLAGATRLMVVLCQKIRSVSSGSVRQPCVILTVSACLQPSEGRYPGFCIHHLHLYSSNIRCGWRPYYLRTISPAANY